MIICIPYVYIQYIINILHISVSRQTWLDMCEAYAKQLEGEGLLHKAVSYLLSSHKIYQAIEMLKNHKLFK